MSSPSHPLPGPGAPLAIAAAPAPTRGAVINALDDPALIAGVEIAAGRLWPDDRGIFTELFRFDDADARPAVPPSLSRSGQGGAGQREASGAEPPAKTGWAAWARGFQPRAQVSAALS